MCVGGGLLMHVNNHKIHLTRNQLGTELSLKNKHKIQAPEDLTMACLALALSECCWENFKLKAHLKKKKNKTKKNDYVDGCFHSALITLDC